MRFAMFKHMILTYETFSANGAIERARIRMQARVPPQVRLVVERFRALVALVRLVSGVLVSVQRVLLLIGEAFTAFSAFERPKHTVETLIMLRQVARFIEILVALAAVERAHLARADRRRISSTARHLRILDW